MMLDILEPLMRQEPNWKAYHKNYQSVVKKNSEMAHELFGADQLDALDKLSKMATNAGKKTEAKKDALTIPGVASVALFGHAIAKAALRVKFAKKAFQTLSKLKDGSRRRAMMGEVLGYDPFKPLIPPKMGQILSYESTADSVTDIIDAQERAAQDLREQSQNGFSRRRAVAALKAANAAGNTEAAQRIAQALRSH